MITHDNGYWSSGITVKYSYGKWAASVNFLDAGFANDNPDTGQISTEGTLHTRYFIADGEQVDGLTAAIDTVKRDAERLGIIWRSDDDVPTIYMKGDGEDPEWPAPAGWAELIDSHAERIGWKPCYRYLRTA